MSIRVGDSVFIRNGTPGVVAGRDDTNGMLRLDTDLKEVQKQTRHGIVNGLSIETRGRFEEILDRVKEDKKDPKERVEALTEILKELELDPANHTLTQYVRSELSFIMNTHGIKPREYSVHESKAR